MSEWDVDLIHTLNVHPDLLSEVRPSAYQFGQTGVDWFGASLTIDDIAGSQQSALFSQACFRPGTAKDTYGTGCLMLLNTGNKAIRSHSGLISTAICQSGMKRSYALEGSVFVGDAIVQWLRDDPRTIQRPADVEGLAASVPDSGGVVLTPSFTGLGAPYQGPTAQGAIISLSRGTAISRIVCAILESITSQSTALLRAITRDAISTISELRVDGGASANSPLLQPQTDLLGIPVVRPEITEITALGAAYLAGITAGFYCDEVEVTQQWRISHTFHPIINRDGATRCIVQREVVATQVRLPTTRGH